MRLSRPKKPKYNMFEIERKVDLLRALAKELGLPVEPPKEPGDIQIAITTIKRLPNPW